MGFIDTFRFFYPDKIEFSWWNVRIRGREKNIGWRLDYIFVCEEIVNCVKSVRIRK